VVRDFLGSASTHLLSGLGGLEGRALRKGDVLQIGEADVKSQTATGKNACPTERVAPSGDTLRRRLSPGALRRLAPRKTLRVTPGPQSDWFPEAARRVFYSNAYRVAEETNRMGIRLHGEPIPIASTGAATQETGRNACPTVGAGEMISEGVSLGAVQIPEGGLPIILFVEQQTTGGYAKIANVVSADLSSLGQLRPRDEIRFERVDFETARSLLIEQERLLASKELIVK
jgi:antagonist of KipI